MSVMQTAWRNGIEGLAFRNGFCRRFSKCTDEEMLALVQSDA